LEERRNISDKVNLKERRSTNEDEADDHGTWEPNSSINGRTKRVRQIIEQTEDYVKFETDSVRYCIDHYGREANVLALVA
jgi:hypothetical protein